MAHQHPTPLFATVSFVYEAGGAEQQTFRVPIDATTTVKALAKNAMFRLSQQLKVSNFGIREIYVGSNEVKLFIHDVVLHVVNIAEERVILVLKDKTIQSNKPDEPHPVAPSVPAVPQNTEIRFVEVAEKSPSPDLSANQMSIVANLRPHRSKSPAPARASTESLQQGHSIQRARMPVPVAIASPKPLGKIAEPRPIRSKPQLAPPTIVKNKVSPMKRARIEGAVLTPEAAKVMRVETLGHQAREQFLNQKAREGWGPEAYRHFESNYTADPDKLARELRKQRQLQAKGVRQQEPIDCDSTEHPTAPRAVLDRSPVQCQTLCKQLFTTTPVNVDPIPQVDEDTARPTGWGVKASMFFDASTYHDDPSKAKLDPAVLNEPIRARRSIRGPLF